MSMKFKTIIAVLVLSAFSSYLFAEPLTYAFSSFGGGLPSSAKLASTSKAPSFSLGTDSPESQRIIIEDDSEQDDTYYDDEPTVNKNKNVALITAGVVLGALALAGIIYGTVYFSTSSGDCCQSATDNMMEGCAEGCGEECGKECGSGCDEAMDQACSSAAEDACSSSSSDVNCSTSSLGTILKNGFQIIPVFIP